MEGEAKKKKKKKDLSPYLCYIGFLAMRSYGKRKQGLHESCQHAVKLAFGDRLLRRLARDDGLVEIRGHGLQIVPELLLDATALYGDNKLPEQDQKLRVRRFLSLGILGAHEPPTIKKPGETLRKVLRVPFPVDEIGRKIFRVRVLFVENQ